MGLFLNGFSLLYKKTNDIKYLKKAEYFFEWLKNNYSKGYSGYCWGYNFPWADRAMYVDAFVPSAVVTGFVCKGIYTYWKITKNPEAAKVINSAAKFVIKDLPITENDEGICFSYVPITKNIYYNASLLAAEVLCYDYVINNTQKNNELILKAINFVINKQLNNGRWNYKLDPFTGKEKAQVDFHQGFILDSIYSMITELEINDENILSILTRGLNFYQHNQFDKDGVSLWRIPKKWPIEIHNQSQGIITFSKLSKLDDSAIEFATKIALWTIENMQSDSGYFFYRINKNYKIKISYIRWAQAWMFLALSTLFSNIDTK